MRYIKNFLAATFLWILLTPVALITLGAASNQLAVIANHDTMPVLINSAKIERDGAASYGGLQMLDYKHSVLTSKSHLPFLCDIFDFGDIESIGDILLDLGYWMWVFAPYLWGFVVSLKLLSLRE